MQEEVFNRPVAPLRPAAAYIGGKKLLAARIIQRIERTPHRAYAEPFVGMGGVFFRRRFIPPAEIINDLSGDVATFFRVLQRHFVPFMDMLKWQLTGRAEFERLSQTAPETLTDLERAARFLYLQRATFGGKVAGRSFGVSPLESGAFNVVKLAPLLADLHERLAGVVIERLPWREFIARYDRKEMLFYLDPPYWGGERDYGKGLFAREDYLELADALAALKGRFILSINDVPPVRKIFARFRLAAVPVTYTVSRGKGRRVRELIVTARPDA